MASRTRYISFLITTLILATSVCSDPDCDEESCPASERPDRYHVDQWGFKVDTYDRENGWDDTKRGLFNVITDQMRVQPAFIPRITKDGYVKMKMSKKLLSVIKEQCYSRAAATPPLEVVAAQIPNVAQQNFYTFNDKGQLVPKNVSSVLHPYDPSVLEKAIEEHLRPVVQEWAGINLVTAAIYGMRRYHNGANLMLHVDRANTHLIGVIMQIDQNVRKDWPLLIIDHDGNSQTLTLKPGDMFIYESAKLPHGRMFPLDGEYYDNMFAHFMPSKAWYTIETITSQTKPDKIITFEDLL